MYDLILSQQFQESDNQQQKLVIWPDQSVTQINRDKCTNLYLSTVSERQQQHKLKLITMRYKCNNNKLHSLSSRTTSNHERTHMFKEQIRRYHDAYDWRTWNTIKTTHESSELNSRINYLNTCIASDWLFQEKGYELVYYNKCYTWEWKYLRFSYQQRHSSWMSESNIKRWMSTTTRKIQSNGVLLLNGTLTLKLPALVLMSLSDWATPHFPNPRDKELNEPQASI